MKTQTGERANKCSQCDFASTRTSHMRRHLKTHIRKSQINARNMTFHPFIQTQDMQVSFENTQWVKAKTNANNVITHLLNHAI